MLWVFLCLWQINLLSFLIGYLQLLVGLVLLCPSSNQNCLPLLLSFEMHLLFLLIDECSTRIVLEILPKFNYPIVSPVVDQNDVIENIDNLLNGSKVI